MCLSGSSLRLGKRAGEVKTREMRPSHTRPHQRLKELLRDVPESEKEAAAERFIRYLEIVIAIVDEAARAEGLTDENEPPTLSYSA